MAGSSFGRDKWAGPKWGGVTPGSAYIWGEVSLSVSPIPWADLDWGTGLGGGLRGEPSEVASIEIPYDTLAPGAPSISVSSEASALVLTLTPPTQNADGTTCLDFKEFEVFYSSSSGIDITDSTTYDGSFHTSSRQYTFATEETTYFRAVAWDHDGNRSAASSEVFGTPTKPGTAIEDYSSNIKDVYVGAGMIGIEFQPPKSTWFGWAGWKLYYDVDDGGGWSGTWTLIYTGPGPGFLHKGLNESYKYKYKCTVLGEDGSETTGTISDNGGSGYQPNASDNSNLLSETIFAERIIATKEIISRTLIGGTLHSLNWTSSTGTEISLDDEVLRMGGSGVGFNSGTGIWLGNSGGTYKFFIGDSSGNKLTWDGTTLNVHGAIVAQSGSSIDGSYLVDLSVGTAKIADAAITTAKIDDLAVTNAKIADATITSAKISDLTFDKITAGTNTASLVIGSGGYIKSSNYSAGSDGFIIYGSGDAEFNDVTVRGAIVTGSGSDLNADYITAGTLTGRVVRTASSGNRAEMNPASAYGHGFAIYNSSNYVTAWMVDQRIVVASSSGAARIEMHGGYNRLGGVSSSYPSQLVNVTLESSVTGRFVYSGSSVFSGTSPTGWTDLDLSGVVGSRRALVLLRIKNNGAGNVTYRFRPDGVSWYPPEYADTHPAAFNTRVPGGGTGIAWCYTDSSGKIEWDSDVGVSTYVYVDVYLV